MATYLDNGVDKFSQVHTYKPDYGFLMQVYGVKQAEYDKGYNIVNSLYKTALNKPLTNQDNQLYRDDAFNKIKDAIRNIAGADLTKMQNVAKAMSVFDPIVKDEDLIYDWYKTEYTNNQEQVANSYKYSTDASKRILYNDYAQKSLDITKRDLAEAKRGDGSIKKVELADFVPFEDIDLYLNKELEANKLEVINSTVHGYDIVVEKNGKKAIGAFSDWAKAKMGDKFDRQFDVIGRVQLDGQIRAKMAAGLTKEQAEYDVSSTMSKQLINDYTQKTALMNNALKSVNDELSIIEKSYGDVNKIKREDVKANYINLKEQKDLFINSINSSNDFVDKITKEPNYIFGNIKNIYSTETKNKFASDWGKTKAMSTYSEEIKPYESKLKLYDLQLKKQMHDERLSFDKYKDQRDFQFKLQIETEKKTGVTERIGDFTSTDVMTKSKLISSEIKRNMDEMFTSLTANDNGVLKAFIDASQMSNVNSSLYTLKAIGTGSDMKLSAENRKALDILFNQVNINKSELGLNYDNINQSTANTLLKLIAVASNEKAKEFISKHVVNGKYPNGLENFDGIKKSSSSIDYVMSSYKNMTKAMDNIKREIYNPDGSLKQQYEGVKKLAGGLYDLSALSKEKQIYLDNLIDKVYNAQQVPVGGVYNMPKLTEAEIYAAVNKNLSTTDAEALKGMNSTELIDVMNDQAKVEVDAVNEVVHLKLNPKKAKSEKLNFLAPEYNITLTFSDIRSNKSLGRLNELVTMNQSRATNLGPLRELLVNPTATVEDDGGLGSIFSYKAYIGENSDGSKVLNIYTKYYDNTEGVNKYVEAVKPIALNSDDMIGSLEQASRMIKAMQNNYEIGLKQVDRYGK